MKKLVYLSVVVSLMLALVPTLVLAHTGEYPLVVDLLAGQTTNIGDVKIWNDADNLYVQFVSTGDCLLETHVAVGASLDDIPQTKKGNPIPGQFEYSDAHACVQEYTYEIDLTWDCDAALLIAAHAATGVAESMWVYSDGNETFTAVSGPGTTQSGDCGAIAPRSGDAVLAWQHSAWISSVNPQFTHGTWVWEAYRAVNPICGDEVDFYKTFTVPGLPNGGTLWVTTDNGYEAYLNEGPGEGFLGSDGVSAGWRGSDLTEPYVTTARSAWSSVEQYDLTDWLMTGDNTFHFAAGNEFFGPPEQSNGTIGSNPGGLIYEAEIDYYADGETAWGCGEGNCEPFPGKNWATYFTYDVQCPVCPSIEGMSTNIELLDSPPSDVTVGALESDESVRIWQEFLGPLAADLEYDLEEGKVARTDGPPADTLQIPAGEYVCSYYVHLDNVGPSSTVQKTGYVQFDANVLGLIISGGNLGTFAGRDLMFAADGEIGYSGTTYPGTSGVNYWRGFDVNYGGNLDDAVFSGNRVDFTMWVVNAHDSLRIILPALP